MKCESLIIKKQNIKKNLFKSKKKDVNDKSEFYLGFKKGVEDSFNEFNSIVDMFKRYKNNIKLLMNEQRDLWLKFTKYYDNQKNCNTSNYLSIYNNWLFNFIFEDINDIDSNELLSL